MDIIIVSVLLLIACICLLRARREVTGGVVNLPEDDGIPNDNELYPGPAGEPQWDGVLPKQVTDYTKPRYVYEDLYEDTEYLPEHGRVIGYRISPELVIHSHIQIEVNNACMLSYVFRFGGSLLQEEDVSLLQQNWKEVSDLRVKAGDTPLNFKWFWAICKDVPVVVHYSNTSRKDLIGDRGASYPLILKR